MMNYRGGCILNKVEPIRDIEDIEEIKRILKNRSIRDYLLFVLGINTGLRISDLLKLKFKDILFDNVIKEEIIIKEKKTGKIKQFPITKSARNAIKEYLTYLNTYEKNDYIFQSSKGHRPISRVQAYRIINEVARKAGVQTAVGTHTLRKTFGYHFYQKYKDVALLQEIFNHSTPSITLRYIGINQDNINKAYRNFNL